METWKRGNMETWKRGNVETWKRGNVESCTQSRTPTHLHSGKIKNGWTLLKYRKLSMKWSSTATAAAMLFNLALRICGASTATTPPSPSPPAPLRPTLVITSAALVIETCGFKAEPDAVATLRRQWPLLSNYVRSCSHGAATMPLDRNTIIGPIEVPCPPPRVGASVCDPDFWGQAVAETVGSSGVSHAIMFLPRDMPCPWSGLGMQGCAVQVSRGTQKKPCFTWINVPPSRLTLDTVLHELGHNWGLYHSGSVQGGEYGDESCAMGATPGIRCFNAPQTWALGWGWWTADFGYNELQRLVTASSFDVDIPAVSVSAYNFVRLRGSFTGLTYPVFVSYRTRTGFDTGIRDSLANRVFIHNYVGGFAYDFDTTQTTLRAVLNDTGDAWTAAPNVHVTFLSRPARDVARIRLRKPPNP